MSDFPAARTPCTECPWRKDVTPGKFPPSRYQALAGTAYDMAVRVFACHKSPEGQEFACAGFLERGADHNMSIRMAYAGARLEFLDRSGGRDLHDDYRTMAVANGVDPDDPALGPCR